MSFLFKILSKYFNINFLHLKEITMVKSLIYLLVTDRFSRLYIQYIFPNPPSIDERLTDLRGVEHTELQS